MRKALSVVLVLLLVIAISIGGYFILRQRQIQRADEAARLAIQRKMVPLQQQKRAILDQMNLLQREYEGKLAETATIQLVFSDLDERLYLEAFPVMLQYGFKGVMVLSEDQVPGQPGLITIRQFEEMVRDGWTYCINWDGESVLWDAFTEVQWKMPESTLDMPDTVYLPPMTYTGDMDLRLQRQGIRMLIHHGEQGLLMDIEGQENSLWHIGAVSWQESSARQILAECVSKRTNLAFDVNFANYTLEGFQDLLYAITTYQKLNTMEVTSFAELKVLFADDPENKRWVNIDALNKEMDILQNQLDILDLRITAISQGKSESEIEEALEQMQTEESSTSAIENEIMSLRTEMDRFSREHPYQVVGSANIELLFTSCNASLFTEVYPKLHGGKMTACIGLTQDEMPGLPGKITIEQFSALLNEGWDACLMWNGQEILSDYLSDMRKIMESLSLEYPTNLYTPYNTYTEMVRQTAQSNGFTTIIHHGEMDLPVIDYPVSALFWEAGCIEWNAESSGTLFENMVEDAKNLVVVLDNGEAYPTISSGLSTLLEDTRNMVTTGRIKFTSLHEGLEMQLEAVEARERVNQVREQGLQDFENRIAEAEARLKE
ncbi:MAG: hypothetical protein IJ719_20015 [Clostridia bacterium]|nr:hypothetical protein [Clostridia bacterium]